MVFDPDEVLATFSPPAGTSGHGVHHRRMMRIQSTLSPTAGIRGQGRMRFPSMVLLPLAMVVSTVSPARESPVPRRAVELAVALFEHQLSPLASAAQRALMNVGPAPMSGDVNVVGMAECDPKTFRTIGGASFRMVLDVGEWDNSVAVNNPGQFGNWASPHYRDLFLLWHAGQFFPLLFSRPAIEQATTQRITLVP